MTTQMQLPIKNEILVSFFLGLAIIFATFFNIKNFTSFNAFQYLLFTGGIWLFVCGQLWKRRELNRPAENADPYPTLGWANRLTLLRGGLIALTGGFLFQSQAVGLAAWIPGLLYTLAAILDRMDGFVARRSKQTSLLGNELDTVYDALGLLIAPVLAVGYGKIHWSFLLVSAAYYIFMWGLYWRTTHKLPVYPLLPSMLRRTLAGFQMGFVAFILLPCFHAPLTMVIGIAFMLPILAGFIVDWLVVSGRISSTTNTTHFFNRIAQCSQHIFQPLLRAVLCIALLLLVNNGSSFSSALLQGILLVAGCMVMLGLAARAAALAILVLVTLAQGDNTVNAIVAAIVFASVWLMLLGSGRFSLWQWDDQWVNRRDGEENT